MSWYNWTTVYVYWYDLLYISQQKLYKITICLIGENSSMDSELVEAFWIFKICLFGTDSCNYI